MLGRKIEAFKDLLPAFMQTKLGFEIIHEPNIPEFNEAERSLIESGGINHATYDYNLEFQNIAQLVYQYQQFALLDFVEEAIDEIVDESIVLDDFKPVVELNLDAIKGISDNVKEKIIEEFNYLKSLMKFDSKADEYFRKWYIAGRYYMQPLYSKRKADGIVGFHQLSPFKIMRFFDEKTNKYFYYISKSEEDDLLKRRYIDPKKMLKDYVVSSDHMIYVPSGLTDARNKYYISHLHKAIKPANMLKMMEDSMVVYRFTRAPERRAFYIDVGRLGSSKAEQYVKSLMNKFKTRLTYDTNTGMINQSKSIMTMLEDYWLPRMGTKGTEVQTISGGQQLGEITDVLYFKRRTWKALKLPSTRADNENAPMMDFGSNEFSREELKFNRFCKKLRSKFSDILKQPLRMHLLAKNIVTIEEWQELFEDKMGFVWNENSYWAETKENALLEKRIDMLEKIANHKDYFSPEYINKRILRRTDEEVKQSEKEVAEYKKKLDENPPVNNDEDPQNFDNGVDNNEE